MARSRALRTLEPALAARLRMLAKELHRIFVLGVVARYGVNQGLGGGINRVASGLLPEGRAAGAVVGGAGVPGHHVLKPLRGLLTDVLPVARYQHPYFIRADEEHCAGLC